MMRISITGSLCSLSLSLSLSLSVAVFGPRLRRPIDGRAKEGRGSVDGQVSRSIEDDDGAPMTMMRRNALGGGAGGGGVVALRRAGAPLTPSAVGVFVLLLFFFGGLFFVWLRFFVVDGHVATQQPVECSCVFLFLNKFFVFSHRPVIKSSTISQPPRLFSW